ncbi:helicase associated domain-containing protein [Colletotrichum karsti]|uniref:Helicase associated domain-containing protein n=1 Tax=Colletotrichum karsti TaxID=1095194 RepID=A0A9P6IFT3_9PEZI|nr:helicase associated domain-containing protein [Colletotrichum karsti]KAF9881960.1 helicase associated domain-containing protein [Colletotrichum karsti]
MVKKGKGKDKAAVPTPAAQPAAASSSKDAAKGRKAGGQSAMEQAAGPVSGKPTVKQIIGGSSWTGKLPLNLFNEFCQKQQWEKPVYDVRKTPEGYACFVTIAAKDPKTRELTTLDPFKIHPDFKHLVTRPTALEARHCAATYALFRVCSMQNKHTVLPPDYKSLWKDFQEIKKQDVKDGKGWMYDADPFKTLKDRQDAKAAAEKKRKEAEAAKERAKSKPGASGLVVNNGPGGSNVMKGWTQAPKIEMGKRSRTQIEALIQKYVVWNPNKVQMSPAQRKDIIEELSKLGFRRSHVEEATDICKDREETLEWMLIHVPEDDIPSWALPESYAAGISVASMDLKKEAAIKRLSASGYSLDLCARVFEEAGNSEGRAAEILQQRLVGQVSTDAPQVTVEELLPPGMSKEELWQDEVAAMESSFGDHFKQSSSDIIQIKLESVENGNKSVEAAIQVRKSPNYPARLVFSVAAQLPAQIKLSVIKQTVAFLDESYREEPMRIFVAVDWIQQNINDIIERPGKLVDIAAVASTASEVPNESRPRRGNRLQKPPKPIMWKPDPRTREEWLRRQEDSSWKKMIAKRKTLPAWQVQEDIVRIVDENHVTIISGETGSGKSTQSMQFILDELYSRGLGNCANMLVTQPRRISALGLADRVAEERCTRVGDEVGYAIRGENRRGSQTRITFVTTGVLLRRLQTSGGRIEDVVASLADVSHIVIDEVHERSLDTDFLLTIVREVMKTKKDLLKLVLMSATLDAASFRNYFTSQGLNVGMVEISGRTYPVEDYYLDDVINMTGFMGEVGDFDSSKGDAMGKTIQKLGARINYGLLGETVKAIDAELSYAQKSGGILIFLPGVAEINQTCIALRTNSSLHVLPLHASLETKEQKRVFAPPPGGKRKVVVATNVAETSITIDDIVAVIDSGKVKETTYDPLNNMRKLEENWASQAACKQRRGRAGRVQAGKCYKLYTRNLEQQMAERPEPEIRRVPLEQMCLSVRAMGMRDVAAFLAQSPTPPESTAVEGAIKLLQRMGALDGDEMTALGQQLAMIPADLRCAKLMVYGAIFGCLDDCVTISAILSTRSPFMSPSDKRNEAREARMRFSRGDGDLLTDLEAFQQWEQMRYEGVGQRQLRSFCDVNFLSYLTLSDISATRLQYYSSLREIGIVGAREVTSSQGQSRSGMALLRALTASAFSPQIARIQYPDKKFTSTVSGAKELDPEARMIKYFTQDNGRVFVHPSSTLFDSQGFSGNATFMSYFTMISTSKTFIRDLTPFNSYTLLLFSGAITLDTLGRGLMVDEWVRLRGWARLGVLVSRLRVDTNINGGELATAMKLTTPHAKWAAFAIIASRMALAEVRPAFINPEALLQDSLFKGPWERYIQAPEDKSRIVPYRIWEVEGNITTSHRTVEVGAAAAYTFEHGITIGPGGELTLEFEENISGRVCLDVSSVGNDPEIYLAYSESSLFAGPIPDATTDQQERDLPLLFKFDDDTGTVCVGKDFIRGAFKYLTLQMPEYPVLSSRVVVKKASEQDQAVLGGDQPPLEPSDRNPYDKPWVTLKGLWVNCTAFPSQSNGRAYSGYFHSSSNMLNRIWYSGAYTLQLSTIDPKEGSSIIDYNRNIDHNESPTGSWYSNFTIANGSAVTTDGAKRDRVVWPGDMYIAVPGIAVSTYDMVAIRNALDVLFDHQYPDGSLPYAGPPLGYRGEFSDTYHLHTLLGAYNYVTFSGDLDWLAKRWPAYVKALNVSIDKVDHTGLMHVTSGADWLRPGMTGHNLEASAILSTVLDKSVKLAKWLGDDRPAARPRGVWSGLRAVMNAGLQQLFCEDTGLYSDNIGRRSCRGPEHTDPQDGNSWALISGATHYSRGLLVSRNLRSRWTKYGAPAVEFPNTISPFASSFELLAHSAADNHDAAVELMLLEWAYLLEGPGFTNSTLAEGFRIDGDVQYPAYWSAARNSHCHGWSSGPTTVLTSEILGIQLLAPAGSEWTVRPHLTKWLGFARGGFATAQGVFEVKLTRVITSTSSSANNQQSQRRGQIVEIIAPQHTIGTFQWTPSSTEVEIEGGRKTAWIAWEDDGQTPGSKSVIEQLDITLGRIEAPSDEEWHRQSFIYRDDTRLVYDESYHAPDVEEREAGVVDWDALEANYVRPSM